MSELENNICSIYANHIEMMSPSSTFTQSKIALTRIPKSERIQLLHDNEEKWFKEQNYTPFILFKNELKHSKILNNSLILSDIFNRNKLISVQNEFIYQITENAKCKNLGIKAKGLVYLLVLKGEAAIHQCPEVGVLTKNSLRNDFYGQVEYKFINNQIVNEMPDVARIKNTKYGNRYIDIRFLKNLDFYVKNKSDYEGKFKISKIIGLYGSQKENSFISWNTKIHKDLLLHHENDTLSIEKGKTCNLTKEILKLKKHNGENLDYFYRENNENTLNELMESIEKSKRDFNNNLTFLG